MKKVICIGGIVADVIIGPIKKLPKNGEVFFIDTMQLIRGGCASNTAHGIAKLGIPVDLVGKVGKDYFGDFLIASLKKDKVNINTVICDNRVSTTSCVVLVSHNGERSFYYRPAANESLTKSEVDKMIEKCGSDKILSNSVLHIASPSKEPKFDIKTFLKEAKQKNMFVTMDVDWNENTDWIKRVVLCLEYIDVFFCNSMEGKLLTGQTDPVKIAQSFIEKGTNRVVLKFGNKGSMYVDKNQAIKVSGYKVKVIDTTGAGDIFVSGFISVIISTGLVNKMEWNKKEIERVLKFANLYGATCVTQIGASLGSEKNIDKLRKILNDNGRKNF